jgi:hypothetical protein
MMSINLIQQGKRGVFQIFFRITPHHREGKIDGEGRKGRDGRRRACYFLAVFCALLRALFLEVLLPRLWGLPDLGCGVVVVGNGWKPNRSASSPGRRAGNDPRTPQSGHLSIPYPAAGSGRNFSREPR